jgi:hypothetical protein
MRIGDHGRGDAHDPAGAMWASSLASPAACVVPGRAALALEPAASAACAAASRALAASSAAVSRPAISRMAFSSCMMPSA